MADDQMMPLRSYEDSASPPPSVEPVNEHASRRRASLVGHIYGHSQSLCPNCAHNTLICEKMKSCPICDLQVKAAV